MRTLRVRYVESVPTDDVQWLDSRATVLELGIRKGELVSIRVLQRGEHTHLVQKWGPCLFWVVVEFVQWFIEEISLDDYVVIKQVWRRGRWLSNQEALTEVHGAFTS